MSAFETILLTCIPLGVAYGSWVTEQRIRHHFHLVQKTVLPANKSLEKTDD